MQIGAHLAPVQEQNEGPFESQYEAPMPHQYESPEEVAPQNHCSNEEGMDGRVEVFTVSVLLTLSHLTMSWDMKMGSLCFRTWNNFDLWPPFGTHFSVMFTRVA